MTDDLDRFAHEITSAALRDDGDALRENVQSLIVTCRQLRGEAAQAWEQAGSDRADLSAVLVELEAARADNAALALTILDYVTSATEDDRTRLRGHLYDMAMLDRPGQALLEVAQIAADYVDEPAESNELGDIYDALEQAVRRWKMRKP